VAIEENVKFSVLLKTLHFPPLISTQWDVLYRLAQWDVLYRLAQWDVLYRVTQWDVLYRLAQWDVLYRVTRSDNFAPGIEH
jgi:hypothetical protein